MDAAQPPFDMRRFLEKFRRLLQVQNAATESELPPEYAKYCDLCEEANRRLRECFVLYQRGQYANAVALSEREPKLLDCCTLLEIPERDDLASVSQILKLNPPTLIDRDLLAALQESYDKGDTAASNLKMLHRLNLIRAPLPTRLFVMRKLAVQNPNHPYLDADIRTFERAWFKRANEFAQQLVKQARPDLVAEIVHDLEEGGYLETPPPNLIPQLQTQAAQAKAAYLPILAKEIRKAFVEDSYEELRSLTDRWFGLVDESSAHPLEAKYQIAEPLEAARQQIAREREEQLRDEAAFHLSDLIDTPETDRQTLVDAYTQALTLRAIDADLIHRYNRRLAEFQRRQIAMIGGLVFAAAVCLALIVILLTSRPSDKAVDESQAEAPSTLPTEITKQDDPFARTLKKIQDAPPDADVEVLLRVAKELANDEPQREKVAEVQRERDAIRKKLLESKKQEFEKKVAALKELSATLLTLAIRGTLGSRAKEVDSVRGRSAELDKEARAATPRYDTVELALIDKTLTQIDAWERLTADLNTFQEEMKTAEANSKTLDRLADFLDRRIAVVFPDAEIRRRAKLAKTSVPAWNRVVVTRDYLKSQVFLKGTPSPIDWKEEPPAEPLTAAAEYTLMIRQRDSKVDGTEASKLKQRLNRSDMRGLWRINRSGDNAYWYTRQPPENPSRVEEVEVLLGGDGRAEVVPIPSGRTVVRAPQSKFADAALKQLYGETADAPWEARVGETYDLLIESKQIDPLLQLDLARRILTLATTTSAGYRERLSSLPGYEKISGRDADISGNWLDPELRDELAAKRKQAETLIGDAPRLRAHLDDVLNRDKQYLQRLEQGVAIVGWVGRDHEGSPSLKKFAEIDLIAESRLFRVEEEKWIELGTVAKDGQSVEFNDNDNAAPIGWPVFAVAMTKPGNR